jgi:hypothetical protein
MPAAVLTPDHWAEVRLAWEAGVSDHTLADRYDVPRATIRKRRSVEGWINQIKLKQVAEIERLKAQHRVTNNQTVSQVPQGVVVAAENLGEIADRVRFKVAPLLAEQICDNVTASPASFGPTDGKSLNTAIATLWKLTNQDKPTAEVNLSLWTTQQAQPERDVTPSSVESVSDEWLE